jgi:hypothetical protein
VRTDWKTYIEVIPSLLRWEFATFLDKISELGLSSLELARFVVWSDPVRDLAFSLRIRCQSPSMSRYL